MVDRKMTDLIGLEFHGLENAGREVGGPNEVSQHSCYIQVDRRPAGFKVSKH